MRTRTMVAVALGALAGLAVAAVVPLRHDPMPARTPGNSHLLAYGVRSSAAATEAARDPKLDSALDHIARRLGQVRTAHAVEDLHVLHPAARFSLNANGQAMVLVDAVTRGDAATLRASLEALGLERSAQYKNDVSGWLPLSQLNAATALGELHSMRAAMARTRAGAITSQGDFAQHSDVVRTASALTGQGVTVGILSDSYNCYSAYASNGVPAGGLNGYANNGFTATAATDISSGDLPSTVSLIKEATCLSYGAPLQLPFGDEGRAMMQIVHDVAPGAALSFYTAENGEADFASGIQSLASHGAKIVADDVGYFDEPFFQDGLIAQAIDTVKASGVTYFTAAGNNGILGYDNVNPSFSSTQTNGENLLNFGTASAASTDLPVSLPALIPGEYVAIVLQWDQPYVTGAASSGGATTQLDLCVSGLTSGTDTIYNDNLTVLSTGCTGANQLGQDPVQIIIVGNPANATANTKAATFNIEVGLVSGTAPGHIKLAVEDDGAGSTITKYATNTGTVQGHSSAAGAASVAAAFYFYTPSCGTSPAKLSGFSSRGGTPILFDVTGSRLVNPVTRQKPDFTAPNGGNDTFLGFTLTGSNDPTTATSIAACKNNQSYPNFFGTSAATPHAAGIAALFLQASPNLTPDDIVQSLSFSALQMDGAVDYDAGYGFIQADKAAVQPGLTFSAPAVLPGGTTTLSWASPITTACTASGQWSGAKSTSVSNSIPAPTAVGDYTYSMTCTDGTTTSAVTSATLSVMNLPAKPTLSLSSTSVTVGDSVTITWSSSGADSCTASGAWSGNISATGSQSFTAATDTAGAFNLVCSNAVGSSPSVSVTLTVNAAPAPSSGGHGGGAMDEATLAALIFVSLMGVSIRLRRQRAVRG